MLEIQNLILAGKLEELKNLLNPENINSYKDSEGESYLSRLLVEILLFKLKVDNLYELVEFLIKTGIDVNSKNEFKRTALMYVKDPKIAKMLIDNGADINHKDYFSYSALAYALFRGDFEVVKLLTNLTDIKEIIKSLELKNLNMGDYYDIPLTTATENKNMPVINALLELGADVNAVNGYWESALYIAVADNDLELTKFFINQGANVNSREINQWTPLTIGIAMKVNLEIIKLLIDNGADISLSVGSCGRDALAIAKEKNNLEVIEFLNSLSKN